MTRIIKLMGSLLMTSSCFAADLGHVHDIAELKPIVTLHVGKTADWVVVTDDAVWTGSTGPFAVHHIDSNSNRLIASVSLPGEPCSGLTSAFGFLWVPLCTKPASLAKVDLKKNKITAIYPVGPAASEGGIAASADSIWLVTDKAGAMLRLDPEYGKIRQTVKLPAGSYNPVYSYSDRKIWVSQAEGAQLISVDAVTGALLSHAETGPNPRFLTSGFNAIWTLNQGDGSVTRVDVATQKADLTIALNTPGHGGDISFGRNIVWTTMQKMPLTAIDAKTGKILCQWAGPGGDSLGISRDAIWLTDYDKGSISRIAIDDALAHCH